MPSSPEIIAAMKAAAEAHRPQCHSCDHWYTPFDRPFTNAGYCRRHPPLQISGAGLGLWPMTQDCDWCAEHTGLAKP